VDTEHIPLIGGYGSGPIEKTVDITVVRRFKKRGMSWYKKWCKSIIKTQAFETEW
jgi:hypothetical protein